MSKHTPWKWEREDENDWRIFSEDGGWNAAIRFYPFNEELGYTIVRLMAAAPEMYGFVELWQDFGCHCSEGEEQSDPCPSCRASALRAKIDGE